MTLRPIAALLLLLPAAAGAADARVERKLDDVRGAIARGCGLQGWQFALEANSQSETRVELSPTMPQAATLCVYQTLANYKVALDRPAPVQVTSKRVEEPATIH